MSANANVVVIVLGLVLLERLTELELNRRHVQWLRARGAVFAGDDGFKLILVGQVLLFILLPIEALAPPWSSTGWWTLPALAVAALAQVLRYWVITTLGQRWSVRVVTLPGAPRITGGPYRFLRHPNYLAVLLETAALPLAFGAIGTFLVAFPIMTIALRRRIQLEDRALMAAAPAPR